MLEVRQILRSGKPPTLIEWFHDRQLIDMYPTYQRRANLWSPEKKKLLINTFLNEYDMPKIYLADYAHYPRSPVKKIEVKQRSAAAERLYGVIDGKQRLQVVFDFFEDNLSLGYTPVYTREKTYVLTGKSYSDLKWKYPDLALRVEDFRPTVMSVIPDRLEEIRDLFIRLNLGIHISGPEHRNAMPGPIPPLIRRVAEHEFFNSRSLFQMLRGQDLNTAAKFLLMEHGEGFVNTKRTDLDRFVQRNIANDPRAFDEIVARVVDTLDKMSSIFKEKDELLRGQAQIPIYYWFVRSFKDPPALTDWVRAFLSDFEHNRQVVRSKMTRRSRGEDTEIPEQYLINYNTLMRTPDDKRNQEGMYRILDEHYTSELLREVEKRMAKN